MKLYTAALLLTAIPFFAQAPPAKPKEDPPAPRVSHIVPIKHLTGSELTDAIYLLRMFGAGIDGNSAMGVIAVSGSQDAVTAVEAAIKALDVPRAPGALSPKNVEITLHVVMGSSKPGDSKLIPGLEPVFKQMRGVFQYQSYKFVDTQLIRTRVNTSNHRENAEFTGILPDENGQGSWIYRGEIYTTAADDARGRTFKFDRFLFECRPRNNPALQTVNIRTTLDVREGQTAVVGKSNLGADSAIFLIVSAKQVD